MTAPIRAFLCDDVPGLRLLLRLALEEGDRIEVVGEAGDACEAIREVARLTPDVVVLDLALPEQDGLQAIPSLREAAPACRILVFSGFAAASMEATALAVGADRYVEKGADLAVLRAAVVELASA